MNTQNRTGGGSRVQKKSNPGGGGEPNTKKTEVKTEKEKPQPKPTAEQIRIAQITDISGLEDPKMREKVATLLEMTQRSEEEVCCALYECDNNLEKAVIFLLETLPVGAFETSSKKKKNRAANATSESNTDGEWPDTNANPEKGERTRNRTNNRGGRGGSDSRGWRGREARENERNGSETKGSDTWRSRGRGSNRGGYGGRGGRGGRSGPRSMGSRDQGRNYNRQQEPQEVDTWDNTLAQTIDTGKADDTWGDWDNEEYTGSLKDTKVFTPSNLQSQNLSGASELSVPPGLEKHMLQGEMHVVDCTVGMTPEEFVKKHGSTVASATGAPGVGGGVNPVMFPDIHAANANQHLRIGIESQQMKPSSTLSAEQSQYFNSLPSQGSNPQANVNSYQNSTVQYQTSYVSGNVFGDQGMSAQPAVRRARAKVPPPSKIPSSAVEMPGDTLNNIGYLDVQFGGLDFGTEDSFDALTEKFNTANIDGSQNVQSQEVSNDYQSKGNAQQSALAASLQTSQMIPCSDALSSQTESLSSSYSQRAAASVQQQNPNVGGNISSATNNTLEQLSKNDPYNQVNASNTTAYQSSYNASASTNKPTTYQSAGAPQAYSGTNYTNTQASTVSTYQPSSNNYNSYNQNSVNSYQQQNNSSVSNSSNVVSGGSVNSSNATQNIPVGAGGSTVNNSSSNANAGYLSSQYQSNPSASAFQSQQSAYPNSQSVYGGTGLNNNTGFTGSTNTPPSQYSNYSSSKLKETSTSASTHYDSVSSVTSSNAVSSTISSVSSSSTTTNSMSSPSSLGLANATKVTNSTAKSNTGLVPNIQMVSQYIQTGLPYYQQPAVYSYEDLQIMQQRMPHVTQYYDINYPPTSLGAAGVREANLGSVAYSTMTDGRFARTDNNSSPVSNVSSTMSQQAGSSGPMLNVPYAYFYGGNMMPGGFQYGTPAIYPQQMPAANATSGGQFPKPSYNSGYGSANYDALSQATQDYSKGAYQGSGVNQQTKTQSVTNPPQAASASDITSSMYGKSHVALNKVNSYEKQSFHSGTPPPFNLTGTQAAGATSAQPYGMYIQPMPAGHHNMNIHQPIHQMDVRVHNTSRRDSNNSGQRQQTSSQSKSGTKQGYSPSYWTAQN